MKSKEELTKELQDLLTNVKTSIGEAKFDIKKEEYAKLWEEMVNRAIELHKIVKPKHHNYMIENRRCSPDDPEFYNHIHPIEDLLKFIKDPHANDDPEDQTIGHDFDLIVFSRRWGHEDIINVKRTETGWSISAGGLPSESGECNNRGEPYLYKILDHDSINYPEELPGYMEWLWERANEDGLSHEKVQEALNVLGSWIKICEKSSPRGIWSGYK